jgi:Mn-dependent DtxR family transcriptional regulator
MILTELKQYLSQHQRAALIDLSHHFDIEPDALRGMLNVLERKGWITKLPSGTVCGGGCSKCDPASVEIYECVNQG